MKVIWLLIALLLIAFFLIETPAKPAGLEDVDVALVLVMDISDSVDDEEFALQRVGTSAALVNPEIVNAISGGALGKIAVSVVEFSESAIIVVPWTVVSDAKSARAFAAMLTAAKRNREIGTGTSISSGISLANNVIATMPYRATRKVIDVSGDGTNNTDASGITMEVVTKVSKAQHIVINGLTIGDDYGLEEFYEENVISVPGGFKLHSDTFKDFTKALRRKLVREIS